MDALTVRVERRPDCDAARAERAAAVLVTTIKDTIGVSLDVTVVEPHEIERSAGKMRRVVDERPPR